MLLARATCSALRIAQRPAGNALCASRRFGAASLLPLSSQDRTTSSRVLSTTVHLCNDTPTSSPPPPAPTSSEEDVRADRNNADPLSPSQTPTAEEPTTFSTSSAPSTPSHFAPRKPSPTKRPPIDVFKARGELPPPSPSKRVFVKGRVFDRDEEALLSDVARALDLQRAQLKALRTFSHGEDGRKRGYGWIELPTVEDAEKLVNLAPSFRGKPLVWAFATSAHARDDQPSPSSPPPFEKPPSRPHTSTSQPHSMNVVPRFKPTDTSRSATTSTDAGPSSLSTRNGVIFRDLAPDLIEAQLKLAVVNALGIEEGDVLSVRLPKKGGRNKGYGFVDLSSPALAFRLVRAPRAAFNLACDFYTKLYQPAAPAETSPLSIKPTNSLYIRDLPHRTSPSAVYAALERFGTVWRFNRVPSKDPRTGAERLAAFVGMETVAVAKAVVEQASSEEGLLVRGSPIRVTFATVLRGKGLRTEKDDEEMARKRRALLEVRKTGNGRKEKVIMQAGRRASARVAKRREGQPRSMPKEQGSSSSEAALAGIFRKW